MNTNYSCPSGVTPLVNTSEIANISSDVAKVFGTLSYNRTITVNKEPIKVPAANPPTDGLFGFGSQQDGDLFTYAPVSGQFPAIVCYLDEKYPRSSNNDGEIVPEIENRVYAKELSIKVKPDCNAFIQNGPTKNILLDGQLFIIYSDVSFQTMLGTQYYIYHLRESK